MPENVSTGEVQKKPSSFHEIADSMDPKECADVYNLICEMEQKRVVLIEVVQKYVPGIRSALGSGGAYEDVDQLNSINTVLEQYCTSYIAYEKGRIVEDTTPQAQMIVSNGSFYAKVKDGMPLTASVPQLRRMMQKMSEITHLIVATAQNCGLDDADGARLQLRARLCSQHDLQYQLSRMKKEDQKWFQALAAKLDRTDALPLVWESDPKARADKLRELATLRLKLEELVQEYADRIPEELRDRYDFSKTSFTRMYSHPVNNEESMRSAAERAEMWVENPYPLRRCREDYDEVRALLPERGLPEYPDFVPQDQLMRMRSALTQEDWYALLDALGIDAPDESQVSVPTVQRQAVMRTHRTRNKYHEWIAFILMAGAVAAYATYDAWPKREKTTIAKKDNPTPVRPSDDSAKIETDGSADTSVSKSGDIPLFIQPEEPVTDDALPEPPDISSPLTAREAFVEHLRSEGKEIHPTLLNPHLRAPEEIRATEQVTSERPDSSAASFSDHILPETAPSFASELTRREETRVVPSIDSFATEENRTRMRSVMQPSITIAAMSPSIPPQHADPVELTPMSTDITRSIPSEKKTVEAEWPTLSEIPSAPIATPHRSELKRAESVHRPDLSFALTPDSSSRRATEVPTPVLQAVPLAPAAPSADATAEQITSLRTEIEGLLGELAALKKQGKIDEMKALSPSIRLKIQELEALESKKNK